MTSISDLLQFEVGTPVVLGNPIVLADEDAVAGQVLDALADNGYTTGQTIDILNAALFWAIYGAAAQKAKPE